MAHKLLKDMDQDQQDAEKDHIDSLAEGTTGLGSWDTPGMIFSENLKSVYGICAGCSHFYYCRQSYQNKRAYCNRFEMHLSGKDRMVECNKYEGRKQLSLNQMMDIAWIIETPKKVGFVS